MNLSDAIGTRRGRLMLAHKLVQPIRGRRAGGLASSECPPCMTCGRRKAGDGCDGPGLGWYPACWRPEGTLVVQPGSTKEL